MVNDILLIVWIHFLSDFILQSSYIALNKSKSNLVLLYHVILYSIPFLYFGIKYSLINLILHYIIDWCTSRITSKLWSLEDKHWFFVVIGLDQALHFTCLILTYIWIIHD